MGATYIFDRNIDRLRDLDFAFGGRADTLYSTTLAIEEMLPRPILSFGAVLVLGAKAPHVVTRKQLSIMKQHAVLVDVSIDQGGCFETSRPTTHTNPTYEVDGITHYCVANMPGAVPITSTYALTNATLPYAIDLATEGVEGLHRRSPGHRLGLNVANGAVTYRGRGRRGGRPLRHARRRPWPLARSPRSSSRLTELCRQASQRAARPAVSQRPRRSARSSPTRVRRRWSSLTTNSSVSPTSACAAT